MNSTRIILVEDNPEIQDLFELLFANMDEFVLAGSYQNSFDIEGHVESERPDILLINIELLVMAGLKLVKKLKKSHPKLRILLLSVFEDDEDVICAMNEGAEGFILMNKSIDQLAADFRESIVNINSVPEILTNNVKPMLNGSDRFTNGESLDSHKLSAREREVLEILSKGASYKKIAEELNLSYGTIHSHIKNIYKKIGVNSMSEAVVKAMKDKLVVLF